MVPWNYKDIPTQIGVEIKMIEEAPLVTGSALENHPYHGLQRSIILWHYLVVRLSMLLQLKQFSLNHY
jgi:hypothetical protein